MGVRRVVTGQDAAGRSVIVSDDVVSTYRPPAFSYMEDATIWRADGLPSLPHDGRQTSTTEMFPGPGGVRFAILTIHPDAGNPSDTAKAGMHATDSVDFGVVLAGEITLEVEDGVSAVLRQGDSFVQAGANHRWIIMARSRR
jgi:hypothetical protein